ncbi:MAG: hypothetical protein HYR56_03540 [Acidobacteria bacterium]|nr:hypothetical protein [Acidobacteriota bacterium]MBI3427024.1 hypothetical protein [Acidobacteriota bacterium]
MSRRKASLLALVVVCLCNLCHATLAAGKLQYPTTPGIWLSQEPGRACNTECQARLLASLRRLTGWQQMSFTATGWLEIGNCAPVEAPQAGSPSARAVLTRVQQSQHVFIVEAHTGSPEVSFGQLDEGMVFEDDLRHLRLKIWRLRLDLADFKRIAAPARVLAAFDPGFVFLHELLHGLGYADPERFGEVGACEAQVNQMRAELGLPLRTQYFATSHQLNQLAVTVRLGFQEAPRPARLPGDSGKAAKLRQYQLIFMPEFSSSAQRAEAESVQSYVRRR